jgi:hypothetical protein
MKLKEFTFYNIFYKLKMKTNIILLLPMILICTNLQQFMIPINNVVTPMSSNIIQTTQNNPDKILSTIRDNIYELAERLYSHTDLERKKILVGELPSSYPKQMKKNAMMARQDHKTSDPIMLYPTAIWRSCVFPNFKISYTSLCRDRLAVDSSTKLNGIFYLTKEAACITSV